MKRNVALLALLVLTACGTGERTTQTISRKWSALEIDKVSLQTVNGEVQIEAGATSEITMEAEAQVWGRLPADGAESLLETHVENRTLFIREKGHKGDGWRVPILQFNRRGHQIDYQIVVPAKVALDVSNVNGEIDVEGIDGATDLTSVNGAIDFTTDSAQLAARTVNGSIDATFRTSFPGAKLRTVNGPVEVTVPAATKLSCNISQVNGGFESNIPVEVRRDEENGNGTQIARLQVSTVNGNIRVRKLEGDEGALPQVKVHGGLPDLPEAPPVPDVTNVSDVPDVPDVPEVPDVPDVPNVP